MVQVLKLENTNIKKEKIKMAKDLTLKQVKELAEKLLPNKQYNNQKSGYAEYIDSLLEVCDRVAEQIDGEFDSVEDLRQIRNERVFTMII